jgi:serine/threonine protein kinase
MIGKTLEHYAVSALIGCGGMGEVYRAKDLKLGRDVAIKILPEEFAGHADLGAVLVPTFVVTPLAGANVSILFGLAALSFALIIITAFLLPELGARALAQRPAKLWQAPAMLPELRIMNRGRAVSWEHESRSLLAHESYVQNCLYACSDFHVAFFNVDQMRGEHPTDRKGLRDPQAASRGFNRARWPTYGICLD